MTEEPTLRRPQCAICNTPVAARDRVDIRYPHDEADRPEYRGAAHRSCYEWQRQAASKDEDRPYLV